MLTEALEIWRALDWAIGQHMALLNLGLTASNGGDLDRAEACQRAAFAVAERIQAPYRLGTSRLLVAHLELRRGNVGTGTRLLGQALPEFRRIQDPLMTANCLFGLAVAASARGSQTLAANLIGAAGALYDASGTQIIAAIGPEHQALLSATRTGLSEDRFETERQHGPPWPPPTSSTSLSASFCLTDRNARGTALASVNRQSSPSDPRPPGLATGDCWGTVMG